MACERHRDALNDAAAGDAVSPALEAHLTSCQACRAELATLRQALALVDDELIRAVSAVPSPELPARIRAAASEPTPLVHGFRLGFGLALAAAAAVALLAIVLVRQRDATPPATTVAARPDAAPAREARAQPAPAIARDPSSAPAPAEARSQPTATRTSARPGRSGSVASEPEVLVPPGEMDALLRFAANLQRRSVPPDSLLVADLSSPLAEPKGVEIQPLEIVPLDPEETSGAE